MTPELIHFGTSGWRSIMAEEFTFANVRRVVGAIGEYLKSHDRLPLTAHSSPIIIGYDTRFLSPEFARDAAALLALQGFSVLLSKDFVPTPVVSFQIRHQKPWAGLISLRVTTRPNTTELNLMDRKELRPRPR